MTEFNIDLSDIVDAISDELDELEEVVGTITGRIGLEVIRQAAIGNPVDTGRSRAGWLMSRGARTGYAPPPGVYDQIEGEVGAEAIVGRAVSVAGQRLGFDLVIVENNVEYVADLNDTHPVAAGFVDIAVANASDIQLGDIS
jgi:hypothetical protein